MPIVFFSILLLELPCPSVCDVFNLYNTHTHLLCVSICIRCSAQRFFGMGHMPLEWVTWPESPKGVKHKVKRAKGPPSKSWSPKTPRLLVCSYFFPHFPYLDGYLLPVYLYDRPASVRDRRDVGRQQSGSSGLPVSCLFCHIFFFFKIVSCLFCHIFFFSKIVSCATFSLGSK